MSRVDERVWQKLVNAFRDSPGNFRNAARNASVDRGTARRAWCIGYPRLNRLPIQELIRLEEEERAQLVRARKEAVRTEAEAYAAALGRDVRDETLAEYERTSQYLKAAAITATNTLLAAHRLQPVVNELCGLAGKLVESVQDEVRRGELTAQQSMMLLEKIGGFMKSVSSTASSATLQGAKIVELSQERQEAMVNLTDAKKAVSEEPFDAAEAKRLSEELAAAAMDAEGGPVLSVLPGGEAPKG